VITSGLRKAALTMAAMHPFDRRWMLSRLPKNRRSVLEQLIAEAKRFGALDSELLNAATLTQAFPQKSEPPAPDVLVSVVDELPPALAARVLMSVVPDHAEMYLSSCGPRREAAIRTAIEEVPIPFPSALTASLSDCLEHAGKSARSCKAPA